MKEEIGKLKEEQLRAAAAAEAEAARLAQLAAQNQAQAAQIEKLEQELDTLRARLEQTSAQIWRLEEAREVAEKGYCTPKSTPSSTRSLSLRMARMDRRPEQQASTRTTILMMKVE